MSAPNILSIAAPLRRLVAFELIVWERGKYEVQRITHHKNFRNPSADLMQLAFVEGNQEYSFYPLPDDIQKRYDAWRAEGKRPHAKSILKRLERYEMVNRLGNEKPVQGSATSEAGRALVARRWQKERGIE